MDESGDMDFFEEYLKVFPRSPSLVLVRSVELKNFPFNYIAEPILDLCCGDGFFMSIISRYKGYNEIHGCDINFNSNKLAEA